MTPITTAYRFQPVNEQDEVSAAEYNKLGRQVEALSKLLATLVGGQRQERLDFGEMTEDAEYLDIEKSAERLYYNHDPSTGETLFEPNGSAFGRIVNPTHMPLLEGSQHLFYFHAPSGRRVAFRTRPVAIAITGSGGIAGRSGSTVSFGTCRIWFINHSDELEDSGVDVEVRNPFVSEIQGNTYIDICEEVWSGKLVAIAVECGA